MVLFDCTAYPAFHLDTNLAEHDTPHDYRWELLWCPGYICRGRGSRGKGIKWMVDTYPSRGIWTRNVKDFLLHPELEAKGKKEAIMVEGGDYEPEIPCESPMTVYCNDKLKF